jgi:hypothetical protein
MFCQELGAHILSFLTFVNHPRGEMEDCGDTDLRVVADSSQ